jgi:signal transduction histidine kinase
MPLSSAKRIQSIYVLPLCIALMLCLDFMGVFAPTGRWLYDHASHIVYRFHWANQATASGVYQQRPVLIAIDELSLQTLGRWPWSRVVHARLLNQLNQGTDQPSVVAWDVVFSEPQIEGVVSAETDEDTQLSQAINRSSFPVVLAAQLESQGNQTRLIQPRQPLSSSTARLAHVQIETDVDGTVRRYWPQDDTFGSLRLPYLGKALSQPTLAPRIKPQAGGLNTQTNLVIPLAHQGEWLYPMPFDWIDVVSYQAVLAGQISPSRFRNAPVLVAATAKGLGDQYVSHLYNPSNVISGGEIVLGAFHTERLLIAGLPRLSHAPLWLQWGGICLTVFLMFYYLRRSASVQQQFLVTGCALAAVSLLGLLCLAYTGVWINAAHLFMAVFMTWLLWVSHTLKRLLGYVLKRLQHQALAIQPEGAEDVIDRQLLTIDALEARKQAEFTRLSEVLELLPDGAFVLNIHSVSNVQSAEPLYEASLQNRAARQLTQRLPSFKTALVSSPFKLSQLLADFIPDLTQAQQQALVSQGYKDGFQWQVLSALQFQAEFTQGIEANGPQGERFLVKFAQLSDFQTDVTAASSVLSVVDLSVSLALSQTRERTFNFLSHDLRAPQATILALLDLEKSTLASHNPVFKKIKFQAERTLHLAEGFVQWSQASHRMAYQFAEYNLNDLMVEALDEQWANAKQKKIGLVGQACEDGLWVQMDRNLMWRALVNIISNALSACQGFSNEAQVELSTRREGDFAVIQIQDNGPGIAPDRQASLFEPFVQGQGLKRTGAGLGLAFVKTVLDQHHGQVRVHSPVVESAVPHGTRFELWLPILPDPVSEDDAPLPSV